jgi:hypothetical protein
MPLTVELSAKRLELAGELVPGASRLAILWQVATGAAGIVRETQAAATPSRRPASLQTGSPRASPPDHSRGSPRLSGRGMATVSGPVTHRTSTFRLTRSWRRASARRPWRSDGPPVAQASPPDSRSPAQERKSAQELHAVDPGVRPETRKPHARVRSRGGATMETIRPDAPSATLDLDRLGDEIAELSAHLATPRCWPTRTRRASRWSRAAPTFPRKRPAGSPATPAAS